MTRPSSVHPVPPARSPRPAGRFKLLLVSAIALTAAVLHGGPAARAGDRAPASVVRLADTAGAGLATLSAPAAPPIAFRAEGEAQASCGGPGQRACCFLEQPSACGPGLREAALGQFPNACGGLGAGTCVPISAPTACGGEGQRACCVGEGAGACQQGLVEAKDDLAFDFFVPVTGDATCSNQTISGSSVPRSQGICVRPTPAPIAEPDAGWSPTLEPRGIMRGYLDMHLHLLGHMAHGGQNVVGEPAPIVNGQFTLNATANINTALDGAKDIAVHKDKFHGLFNDSSGEGTGDGARSQYGAPYFSGWPKWTSTTHQQTYYVWLERAWRGGLRATTLFASHVESLCKASLKATRATSWPLCEDSMLHVVDQLRMAYDFQRFIDERAGGPGLGWFRIVTTPQAARDALRRGQLAVVLGIEVDNLFNCKEAGCPADFGLPAARIAGLTSRPQPTTLEEAVDVVYDMGVRQIFPIHNFDNAFGAAATWMDPIAVGQAIAQQRWWVVRDCGDTKGDYGFWLDNFMQDVLVFLGFGVGETPPIPAYVNGNLQPAYASCNQFGLQATGARLLTALMNKGMLIDIDHMSAHSLDETIALTSRGPDGNGEAYPLLASHVLAFDLYRKEFTANKGRHERMRTRAQLDAIRASGGMVAAMLKSDTQDNNEDPLRFGKFTVQYTPARGATVVDDCRHSSKTWAQSVQYLVDVMGGPVAMGSDFNGAAGHLGPRFGSDACGGWGLPNGFERPQQELDGNRVGYPFTLPGFGRFDRQVTGFKAFDYNVDGLAHVGLLPDLMADVQGLNVDAHYVDAVFCSAEAYVRVWERAEALAARRPAPDPARPWLCTMTDATPPSSQVSFSPSPTVHGWNNGDVVATITATDADSGVERLDYSVTVAGQTTTGGVAGAVATATIGGEGQAVVTHAATDVAGNVEAPPGSASVRIDRTAPTIAATRTPAANAAGWVNGPVTVQFQCADGLSGVASCEAAHVLAAEGANQSVTGSAEDLAGNTASATMTGIDIDLTAPSVTISGVTDGAVYTVGHVPQAACHTSDALSGVDVSATLSVSGGTSNGVGSFTVTCANARDRAGNTATARATYAVRYTFVGFFSPVNNLPVVNTVRAGQTVPVKFSLTGNFGLDVLQGGNAMSVGVGCTTGIADPVETVVTSPGASPFSYDPVSDRYQFNWKTDRAWAGTCRRLLVRFDDGTVQTAEFRLQ